MPSFNKVIVMGNLTRDPDVRTVGMNAVKVCRFSLALNERREAILAAQREAAAQRAEAKAQKEAAEAAPAE